MTVNPDESGVEELLEFLRDSRSLDFTGYKRPSLTRRIRRRMETVQVETFEDYRDYLEVHPDEHGALVDTILINVTSFFRDPEAWTYLVDEVVPAIVAAKPSDSPIRLWSAGCATGEEAYTLAMVLAEHLGIEEFKARVKIYATDTDESALAEGRAARYSNQRLDSVPSELRARYFEPDGDRFMFRSDCRRSVIFGRHDVTRDAPISRLDLLVCRNVLMYLLRDTQRRALSRFHYALNDGGFLFLGKAETIFAHADLFTATSSRYRVFTRASEPVGIDGMLSTAAAIPAVGAMGPKLEDLAAGATPVAQLIVDVDGTLVSANTRARALFGVGPQDLGRPFRDLEVSFRPVELRSQIEQAYAETRPVVLHGVERPLADGTSQFLEITIAPLVDASGLALGVSISFADVSELARVKVDLEHSARDLQQANESLHSANEELETSNEELQSTNEELETTNEELQSANEELETMNEELQSANEELETMNEELLDQAKQIEQSGLFLSGLVNSLTVGVVVVDDELDVIVWNRTMEDLFGLRAEETTGRSILALDMGLPLGDIASHLHAAAKSSQAETGDEIVDAVNRRGQTLRCRVTVDTFMNGHGGINGHGGDEASHRVLVLVDPLPDGM